MTQQDKSPRVEEMLPKSKLTLVVVGSVVLYLLGTYLSKSTIPWVSELASVIGFATLLITPLVFAWYSYSWRIHPEKKRIARWRRICFSFGFVAILLSGTIVLLSILLFPGLENVKTRQFQSCTGIPLCLAGMLFVLCSSGWSRILGIVGGLWILLWWAVSTSEAPL